jgi:hypothetical protein
MQLGYKRIQLFQGTSPQYSQRKKPGKSPTNMSNIHQLVSEKGKRMIVHDDLFYTLERTSEEKLIFRCKNRSCKGKLKLIERRLIKTTFSFKGRCHTNFSMNAFLSQPTSHSHAPTPDAVPVIELKNKIKTRAATTDEQSSAILLSALRTFPLSAAGQLPRAEMLMNTIRRQRPTPKATGDGLLADHIRKTDQ